MPDDPCIAGAKKAVKEAGVDREVLTQEDYDLMLAEAKAAMQKGTLSEWSKAKQIDMREEAFFKKKIAAFNALRTATMSSDLIRNLSPKSGAKIFDDVLVGANSAWSASYAELGKYQTFINRTFDKLTQKHGNRIQKVFERGELDEEIAQDMWAIDGIGEFSGNDMAKDIAAMLNEFEDMTRARLNSVGANIKKRRGHALGQIHSPYKLRKEAGSWDRWWSDISDDLNWQETFGVSRSDYEEFPDIKRVIDQRIQRWYRELASGNHLADFEGGKGGANVARASSKSRKIIFKDGKSFMRYQKKYGHGTLVDALGTAFSTASRQYGILSKLGPSYEDNVKKALGRLVAEAESRGDEYVGVMTKLDKPALNRIDQHLRFLDGRINIPGNDTAAAWGLWMRGMQTWSKLGSASLSMVSDPINQVANFSGLGENLFKAMGRYMKVAFGGVPSQDKKAIAAMMGSMTDDVRLSIMGMINPEEMGKGYLRRINDTFGKISFISQISNWTRRNTQVGNATFLGEQVGRQFDDLMPLTRETFREVGITADDWEILRTATRTHEGLHGAKYTVVTAEALEEIDDSVISGLLQKQGKAVNKGSLKVARQDLEDKLRSWYVTNELSGTMESNGATRSMMLNGTQAGTIPGEINRFFWQFKTFPTAVISQRLVRDFAMRRAANGTADALGHGAAYLAGATSLGFLALQLKALRDGRVEQFNRETFMAALLQGGGMGILGDMFLGDMSNRYGNNALTALAGPTAGTFNSVFDLITKAREQAAGGDEDAIPSLYRLIKSHIPGGNLFYTKPLLDPYVFENFAEMINPGTTQRIRNMQREDTGATYIRGVGESTIEALLD